MNKQLKSMSKTQLLEEIIFLGGELEDRMNWNSNSTNLNKRAVEAINLYGKEEIEKLSYDNAELEYALQFIER